MSIGNLILVLVIIIGIGMLIIKTKKRETSKTWIVNSETKIGKHGAPHTMRETHSTTPITKKNGEFVTEKDVRLKLEGLGFKVEKVNITEVIDPKKVEMPKKRK